MSSRIRSTLHRLCVGDEGQTTVETAFGLAALVTVMATALSGLVTIAMYLGLTDAAGAIARAEARGDAETVAELRADADGQVAISETSGTVRVTIRRSAGPFSLEARAVALRERVASS
ncbi:hypothetical protein F6I42_06335 [Corynebacterium amycolatum]|uniref:TadE family type IV pilus minor pilin n=1 Tax=Corynebacterium amycolatum TaxID=43765 RepID=UPI0012456DA5|nr:TadE family type IV pilus minor pilin [Corynebacterium amycolatum]KAA9226182.1 hypothetical protein F6I42_06335 [Corynebacterium amycolatum]